MTESLVDMYDKQLQQENFGALVAARVNEIRSGKATELNFEKIGALFHTTQQNALMFADTIARVVCANLNEGE